ncbi:MAG: DUF374 domain-containing protein [Myxococcota bacterium]
MGKTNLRVEEPQQQSDAHLSGRLASLRLRIFGILTGALIRILGATWRVQILGVDPYQHPDQDDPATTPVGHLGALFHESLVPCAWFFRDRRYSVAVSRSRDGNLIRSSLLSLGYREPARGSSSRGGAAALLGLVRQHADGATVSVLVDGPRGPARMAKTGVVSLGRLINTAIQPVAFSATPALRLSSWDRSLIPFPFARVVCVFGQPISVAPKGDEEDDQLAAHRLDERLIALHDEADRALLGD